MTNFHRDIYAATKHGRFPIQSVCLSQRCTVMRRRPVVEHMSSMCHAACALSHVCVCVHACVCVHTATTCVLRASPPMTGGQGSWLHVVTPHQRADVTVVTCPCVIAFTCSPCTTPACRCGRADLRTMPAACLAYNHQLGALKNPVATKKRVRVLQGTIKKDPNKNALT